MLLKTRIYFTCIVTIGIWSLLIWSHYHGGVPVHHLLARQDLPGFSNWWGGFTVPLLTWWLLYRIQQRIYPKQTTNGQVPNIPKHVLYGFIGGILFGAVLSTFFTLGNSDVPPYMLLGLLLIAPFLAVHRSECLLGFVLGMTFTFGGVLPIIIGSILTLMAAALYLLLRPAVLFVIAKIRK
jgi:hypothetical protein